MAEVFLLQPRQGAIFVNIIEEIEHCRRQGIILTFFAKPGDRLFVADIKGDGQLRVDALEQTDGDRISDGIVEFAIDNRLHQRRRAALIVHVPLKVGIFLLFQCLEIVNRHVPGSDGQLLRR